MKKLSLLVAAVIVSTAMFAGTPSGKDQDGKSSKASKAQTLKKTKPLKKFKATQMTPKEESKIYKKK